MKRSILLIVMSLFAASAFGAKADYFKCRESLIRNMGFANPMFGVNPYGGKPLPIEFRDDGSTNPRVGVNKKTTDGGKKEIFEYETTYSAFEGGKMIDKKMKHQMIVTRNDAGEISEIFNGDVMTTDSLKDMKRIQDEQFAKFNPTPEESTEEKLSEPNFNRRVFQPPFRAPKGIKISMSIKNGQCVPERISRETFMEAKADGETSNHTVADLNLCHDVNEFLEANPDVKSCFRKDVNDRMKMIFQKYAPQFQEEISRDPYSPFSGGYGGFGGGYIGLGSFPIGLGVGGLAMTVTGNSAPDFPGTDPKLYEAMLKRMGDSPVINGQKVLQSCLDAGLGSYLVDDKIWKVEQRSGDGLDANDPRAIGPR